MTIESTTPAHQHLGDAGITEVESSQRNFVLAVCAGLLARFAVTTRAKLVKQSTLAAWILPLVLLATAMISPLSAQAQTNFIYVNNQAAANSVSAFSVPAGGTPLTAVPGSPFATGGTGAASACSSLDRIVVSAANNLLFVSNSGDQTISAFSIDPATGALSAAAGSPFASGLTLDSCQGMSLAVTPDGHFLMASSNGEIKSFAVSPAGVLTPSATTANSSSPTSSMKISANGQFLALSNLSNVSVYSISPVDGSLTPTTGSPFAMTGTGQGAGLDFSCNAGHLFGSENSPTSAIADAWNIAPTGALTAALGSPFVSTGAASSAVLLTPDNTLLYQSEFASNAIAAYSVNANGTLASVGSFGGAGQTQAPAGMATDAAGNLLYAADDANGVAVFTINNDGTLTFVANTPITGAGQIQGIAAYPPKSCAVADLTITMTGPATTDVTAGAQNLTYTINVANHGPAASSFNVTDNLERGLFTKASCTAGPGATCDKGSGIKRLVTFNLGPGQSGSFTVGATTGTSTVFLNGDILNNTVNISNAPTADPNPNDNIAIVNTTVTAPIVAGKIVVTNESGPYFGSTTLQASLSRAAPAVLIAGKTLSFSVNGTPMGTGVTDANGVATLPISLAGLNAGSYSIGVSFAGDTQLLATTATGTLTVTKAPLTITPVDTAKFYGDANPAFTYTVTGFLTTDTIAVVGGTAACTANASAVTQVGTSVITCTTGTLTATNYSFVFIKGTLTINPALLVMAGDNVSRLYGDVNPPITGTLVGLKNGDAASATFAVNAVPSSAVGVYPIIGTLVPGKSFTATNYVTSSSGNLTITPAPLTATVGNATRVYGDANPTFTGTLSGLKNGDVVTAIFTTTATPASPVGSYPITAALSGPAAANYTVVTSSTLTVTPAPLSVSAANATRLYGDANPAFTGTISGIKNLDNITATFASVDATSPIGSFAITPTLVDPTNKLANYTVTSTNGTLTISPAPLSVSAANFSRAYGDANPAFTGTISGLKNSDAITASFATTATAASNIGTFAIVPTLADPTAKLGNYTVTSTNGVLTVTAAPLSVAGADATRVYGDPNPAFTGTITGLKNNDSITATFASTATTASNVGSFAIVPTLADPAGKLANYAVTSTNGALSITKAPLTVSSTGATRVYGDPNPPFSGSVVGLKNNDNITATFASAATAASNVGSFAIVPTLVDPAGKLANYAVVSNNGTLVITPAALSVSAGDATRVYGDPNPLFSGTILGLKNADNITASFASAAAATSPVGTFAIVPTLVDPTNKLGNYTVVSTNGVLTVTKAPLTVSAGNATRLYGDANPVFAGTILGLKNADNITATYASVDPTSAVGTYSITPTLVDPGAKLGNYTVTSNTGTLTITAAPLSVAAANATRIYGDANPAFTGTITGLKNSDAITASFSSAATAASPVGTFAIVPALADPTAKLGNYSVTLSNGTLTVTKAALSVSAADASRIYGDANPAFTGTILGLKNGDGITVSFSSAAVAASPVGSFAIVPALADPTGKLSNYALTSTNGTLTITPAALSVSAANATRLYGDANPAFTGTIAGLKNSDAITATFATTATPASNVGTFSIVPTLVDPAGKLGNYTVLSNNAVLTITPAPLSVTPANATRLYGDANPVFAGTIVGLKNGDVITATYASVDATTPVGTYSITPTLVDPGAKLGNYSVTTNTGTLTITPAPLSVVTANASRIYGDANPTFSASITGLKNADNITATFSTTATAASSIGTFSIVPALVDPTGKLVNYTVTSSNGTLTVTAASLSVTGTNASRIYGDANPALTGTILGLKNGDGITVSFSSAAVAGSPVGSFAIVPALADPTGKLSNYAVTSTNGTLTITPAALSVSAANATRLYGDANPAFTGTITGLKNSDAITATFATTATPASNVGTFSIVPTLVDPAGKLGNYTVLSNNAVLTITPAPLSVTPANATRLYGDTNPVFAGSIVGLKNGDVITATYASADATTVVGTYSITPTLVDPGAKLGNYSVTTNTGTLTITPAPLSVVTANASRIYGDANPTFSASITGLKNADNITATFSTTATAASSIGTFSIVPALVDPTGKLVNYTVKSSNGTLTVTAAPLSVTGANASRIYGDANPAFTGTILGLKNSDAITATFASTATAASSIGTYTIVPTVSDPTAKLANYTLTLKNGALTVTAAPLSVTGANASRVYGDANPVFTGSLTGIKNGDAITASYASAAVIGSPVGAYAIVPTLADPSALLGNYTVSSKNGTLTIAAALLSVVVDNASRIFGQPDPTFTGTITGVKNGDAITANYITTATAASIVGNYPITAALVDPTAKLGNYTVTSKNAVLTVQGPVQGGSVTPAAGIGASATFTYTFSSFNGAADVKTLFMQTSTSSAYPSSCAVMYDAVQNLFFLIRDDATGWLPSILPGGTLNQQNSQCTISGPGSSVVRVGNSITVTLPITFSATYLGSKSIFLRGVNKAGIDSGWQVKGSWTPNAIAVAPTVVSAAPNVGSGAAQKFVYTFSDVNGFRDIKTLWAQISNTTAYPSSCAVMYDAIGNHLFLIRDDGNAWLLPITPGTATTQQNSQCTIDASASSVVGSGNSLVLTVSYSFKPAYVGLKNMYIRAQNSGGLDTNWQQVGTWTTNTPAAVAPTVVSVTPNAGTGTSQVLSYSFSTVNGFHDVKTIWANVATTSAYPSSCAAMYDAVANRLYIIKDNLTGWAGPIIPGVAGTLTNGQCSIDGATSSVVASGNNISLNLSYTFAPTYTGTKNIFGRAMNQAGLDSGWQLKGTWIP